MVYVALLLGSLSTRVFETRTATGSELFSLLTFPHITTFTLLCIFSPLEMNSIKIWETIRSKNANCSLPVAVRVSKTRVLKLPIISQRSFRQTYSTLYQRPMLNLASLQQERLMGFVNEQLNIQKKTKTSLWFSL